MSAVQLNPRLGLISLTLVVLVALAACSGSNVATPSPTPSPTPSLSPSVSPTLTGTPVPTATLGPATAAMVLTGPTGATGALNQANIRCQEPSPTGGPQIEVLARPVDPNLSVHLFISSGSVAVSFDSGAGSTYVERDFTGSGVTGFDPARGVTLDTALTETTPAGSKTGTLGVLTHLSGTVDCGNQQPGSATLALSGTTSAGELTGGATSPNVECVNSAAYGPYVTAQALVSVGGKTYLAIVYFSAARYSLSISNVGFFVSTKTTEITMSATGAGASGDLTQEVAAGKTAYTVHLSGSVACGTFVSN